MPKLIKQIIIDTLAPTVDRVALYLLILANLLQNVIMLNDPELPKIIYIYIQALNWLTMLICLLVTAFFYAVRKQLKNLKSND